MVIFFFLISFVVLNGAYVIPNYYPVFVRFHPLNQAVLNQIHLASINNHNPHYNHYHNLNHMNYGNIFNQQFLANNYYKTGNKEASVTGSELNAHSAHSGGENAGSLHDAEKEKYAEGGHDNTDTGKLEEQTERGSKKKKKKLKKGFHDVYKKREKKSREKFWNNYDRKGSYYKSKINDGEHYKKVSGKEEDPDFKMMNLEKKIKDGDWDNGFILSWKMEMAPNGTYVRYDQDFKEGYFDPSWSQDYHIR